MATLCWATQRLRRTLTPLRFFLACICEGLGVDSGLAIWLERKRKADFSGLGDRLPGLGRPWDRRSRRAGLEGGVCSPLLPGDSFQPRSSPLKHSGPTLGSWSGPARPRPSPLAPRSGRRGTAHRGALAPAPATRSPRAGRARSLAGGGGAGPGGLGFRGSRWERAWKEQMPLLPTGRARRPPALRPACSCRRLPRGAAGGEGEAASGSQALLGCSGTLPWPPRRPRPPSLGHSSHSVASFCSPG